MEVFTCTADHDEAKPGQGEQKGDVVHDAVGLLAGVKQAVTTGN